MATAPKYSEDMPWWSQVLSKLAQRRNLSVDEAKESAYRIFTYLAEGKPETPVILAGYFGGLTVKEPTIDELAGMAIAMEETKLFKFRFDVSKPVVTAGGTGGDTMKTINVTTPAVIIAAAAGAVAVKSAAKAFSSTTGAADLASTMGINVHAPPEVVKKCVEELGTTVWASAMIYPWMEPLLKVRDMPTAPALFPLLQSLRLMIATALNPFSVRRQLRGTALPHTELVAKVLSRVGYEKALVPVGYGSKEDIRIDEFSSLGKTVVSELKPNGLVETYEVKPEDLGVKRGDPAEVKAQDTHEQNTKLVLGVLSGKDRSSRRDLILLNAGGVLYLADEATDLRDGYELARNALDSGAALEKARQLVVGSGGDAEKLSALISSL